MDGLILETESMMVAISEGAAALSKKTQQLNSLCKMASKGMQLFFSLFSRAAATQLRNTILEQSEIITDAAKYQTGKGIQIGSFAISGIENPINIFYSTLS